MHEADLFLVFIRRLNQLGLPYMVTGSVACIAYGQPRLTHDVDLVVVLGPEDGERVGKAFPLAEFYCPPAEVIAAETSRPTGGHFNLIHHETGFKADCFPAGHDPLHVWGMARRRRIVVDGEPVFLAPPEYVILRKLQYFREGGSEKHLHDIEGILAVSSDLFDWPELESRIQALGLSEVWARVPRV